MNVVMMSPLLRVSPQLITVATSEWSENLNILSKVVKTGAKVNVMSTKVLQDFASHYPKREDSSQTEILF